jgi:hypothetical protein
MQVPEHMERFVEENCTQYLREYLHRPLKTEEFAREMDR